MTEYETQIFTAKNSSFFSFSIVNFILAIRKSKSNNLKELKFYITLKNKDFCYSLKLPCDYANKTYYA